MKKNIGHIPLLIITVLMVNCIYVSSVTDIIFSYEHYIGLVAIIIAFVALFIKQSIAKLVTGLVLVLSIFTIAAFTAYITYQRIGFSSESVAIDVKIQPYCILILLLYIFLNFDFLSGFFRRRTKQTMDN